MKSLSLVALLVTVVVSYPLYKQCDPKWGNTTMGVIGYPTEDDTICDQGCAMSCVSMALASFGVQIYGQTPNPGNLNAWLQKNSGYQCLSGDCCNLVLDSVEQLAPSSIRCLGEPLVPFYETVLDFVTDGLVVIAHVRNQSHFVLLTESDPKNPNSFLVNDPFYNQTSYAYSEIHDVIIYDMLPISGRDIAADVN
eukprot:TRINITY_DN705_c0_g1_i2.p1 TRINITY_DN705_c0_g1~~TRINITY_DN705_c0_g1_i2.p1  ORF type:complete len:202 (-),score=3.74 TRINITY_DN705_c0_g1_i2:28-612(-)